MDGIACFLRREVRDVKIDRGLRPYRVFIIAHQEVARSEDLASFLIESDIGSGPTINLERQGTQRRGRRNVLAS